MVRPRSRIKVIPKGYQFVELALLLLNKHKKIAHYAIARFAVVYFNWRGGEKNQGTRTVSILISLDVEVNNKHYLKLSCLPIAWMCSNCLDQCPSFLQSVCWPNTGEVCSLLLCKNTFWAISFELKHIGWWYWCLGLYFQGRVIVSKWLILPIVILK